MLDLSFKYPSIYEKRKTVAHTILVDSLLVEVQNVYTNTIKNLGIIQKDDDDKYQICICLLLFYLGPVEEKWVLRDILLARESAWKRIVKVTDFVYDIKGFNVHPIVIALIRKCDIRESWRRFLGLFCVWRDIQNHFSLQKQYWCIWYYNQNISSKNKRRKIICLMKEFSMLFWIDLTIYFLICKL